MKYVKKQNDSVSRAVLGRIEFATDLQAQKACYHKQCDSRFRQGKGVQHTSPAKQQKTPPAARRKKLSLSGKKVSGDIDEAFETVVKYVENDENLLTTVHDLVAIMKEALKDGDKSAYSPHWLKQRLINHFETGNIVFSEVCGKKDVVSLKNKASQIVQEFYVKERSHDEDHEKKNICAAIKLIKSDIKEKLRCELTTKYPSPSALETESHCLDYLPTSLKEFLSGLFSGKNTNLKIAGVG